MSEIHSILSLEKMTRIGFAGILGSLQASSKNEILTSITPVELVKKEYVCGELNVTNLSTDIAHKARESSSLPSVEEWVANGGEIERPTDAPRPEFTVGAFNNRGAVQTRRNP